MTVTAVATLALGVGATTAVLGVVYGILLRPLSFPAEVMQIQNVVPAPRSPWQNAYVERFIGSIRRECLDYVIVFNAAGLQRVVSVYVEHHMRSRTHLGLEKDSPTPRPYWRRPPGASW